MERIIINEEEIAKAQKKKDIYFMGDRSPVRWLAAAIDNAISVCLTMFIAFLFINILPPYIWVSLIILIYFAYYFISEGLWSRTLGKKICSLTIVSRDLGKISWMQAFIRTLFRVIEINPITGLLIGSFFVIFTPRRQRLGDIAANTVVQFDYK